MRAVRAALVGANGLIGREFLRVLEQRRFPLATLVLLASNRAAGTKYFFNHGELEVRELVPQALERIELALFATGEEISRYFSPIATRKGVVVVDSSPAWRMDPRTPLVVPEVNYLDLKRHRGIIASPDCVATVLATVLWPLHRVNPVKRVIVDTYQSVSDSGQAGVEELTSQSRLVLDGKEASPHIYPHQIAFNLLPEIGVFQDNGYTRDELMVAEEARKVMHAKNLAVSVTCVRVPVLYGLCEAVHAEFSRPMAAEEARSILAQAPGVKVLDDPLEGIYPQPWAAIGSDLVYVGRLRQDTSNSYGLGMWIVADNLRKGTALNAVQIAEELIRNDWM
ncbi:MAG: aspartate-semialdehyde dehydrogenase [Chloroflexi bacterium]|nr:aspartate-semialdehyde dehydrogenase [Chloroflexota bacterium]